MDQLLLLYRMNKSAAESWLWAVFVAPKPGTAGASLVDHSWRGIALMCHVMPVTWLRHHVSLGAFHRPLQMRWDLVLVCSAVTIYIL